MSIDDSSVSQQFSARKQNSSVSEISTIVRRRTTMLNMEQYAIDGDGRYQVADEDTPQESTFKRRRETGTGSSPGHKRSSLRQDYNESPG